MNDYKELIAKCDEWIVKADNFVADDLANHISRCGYAIEHLVKEREYIPTDTLRKYHAWLLEEYHKNPTSENLHSIDMAISWLKAYANYKCVNVNFCD